MADSVWFRPNFPGRDRVLVVCSTVSEERDGPHDGGPLVRPK